MGGNAVAPAVSRPELKGAVPTPVTPKVVASAARGSTPGSARLASSSSNAAQPPPKKEEPLSTPSVANLPYGSFAAGTTPTKAAESAPHQSPVGASQVSAGPAQSFIQVAEASRTPSNPDTIGDVGETPASPLPTSPVVLVNPNILEALVPDHEKAAREQEHPVLQERGHFFDSDSDGYFMELETDTHLGGAFSAAFHIIWGEAPTSCTLFDFGNGPLDGKSPNNIKLDFNVLDSGDPRDDSEMRFIVAGEGAAKSCTGAPTFSNGVLYRILVTVDTKGFMQTFLDGVQLCENRDGRVPSIEERKFLHVGKPIQGANDTAKAPLFVGELGNLKLWNRAVTWGEAFPELSPVASLPETTFDGNTFKDLMDDFVSDLGEDLTVACVVTWQEFPKTEVVSIFDFGDRPAEGRPDAIMQRLKDNVALSYIPQESTLQFVASQTGTTSRPATTIGHNLWIKDSAPPVDTVRWSYLASVRGAVDSTRHPMQRLYVKSDDSVEFDDSVASVGLKKMRRPHLYVGKSNLDEGTALFKGTIKLKVWNAWVEPSFAFRDLVEPPPSEVDIVQAEVVVPAREVARTSEAAQLWEPKTNTDGFENLAPNLVGPLWATICEALLNAPGKAPHTPNSTGGAEWAIYNQDKTPGGAEPSTSFSFIMLDGDKVTSNPICQCGSTEEPWHKRKYMHCSVSGDAVPPAGFGVAKMVFDNAAKTEAVFYTELSAVQVDHKMKVIQFPLHVLVPEITRLYVGRTRDQKPCSVKLLLQAPLCSIFFQPVREEVSLRRVGIWTLECCKRDSNECAVWTYK